MGNVEGSEKWINGEIREMGKRGNTESGKLQKLEKRGKIVQNHPSLPARPSQKGEVDLKELEKSAPKADDFPNAKSPTWPKFFQTIPNN